MNSTRDRLPDFGLVAMEYREGLVYCTRLIRQSLSGLRVAKNADWRLPDPGRLEEYRRIS
jgi:hypothetical protein